MSPRRLFLIFSGVDEFAILSHPLTDCQCTHTYHSLRRKELTAVGWPHHPHGSDVVVRTQIVAILLMRWAYFRHSKKAKQIVKMPVARTKHMWFVFIAHLRFSNINMMTITRLKYPTVNSSSCFQILDYYDIIVRNKYRTWDSGLVIDLVEFIVIRDHGSRGVRVKCVRICILTGHKSNLGYFDEVTDICR